MAQHVTRKASTCPVCRHTLNRASNTPGSNLAPQAGDISVCLGCAAVLIFDDDHTLHQRTDAELSMMEPDVIETVRKTQKAVLDSHLARENVVAAMENGVPCVVCGVEIAHADWDRQNVVGAIGPEGVVACHAAHLTEDGPEGPKYLEAVRKMAVAKTLQLQAKK
jgi:hypothetical protein